MDEAPTGPGNTACAFYHFLNDDGMFPLRLATKRVRGEVSRRVKGFLWDTTRKGSQDVSCEPIRSRGPGDQVESDYEPVFTARILMTGVIRYRPLPV